MGATTTRNEDSMHSMQHNPYQGAMPNRVQSNPGLLRSQS